MTHKKHTISAEASSCYDLTIMQHIPADQLEALEKTYSFMLEAVREALKQKRAAEKKSAEIIALVTDNKRNHDRQCLKIAAMTRRGLTMPEISLAFSCAIGCASDIKRLAAHGRKLYRQRIVDARKNIIIKSYLAGLGPRYIARTMPAALGTCSPSYASKVIRAWRLRNQAPLPFKPEIRSL